MPKETIGETVTIRIADHPDRTESSIYKKARAELMSAFGGGCVVCGGESDLGDPEVAEDPKSLGLEDHHGGGLWFKAADGTPVLVALNLFPIEWSEGWGADPTRIAQFVDAQNALLRSMNATTYDQAVVNTQDVMNYADSVFNANIKLCHPHHVGHQTESSKDHLGHEAVGIHNIPGPIFWYQRFCDWANWDMWGGTTGTVAVAPTDADRTEARILHVSPYHPDMELVDAWHKGYRDIRLGPDHSLTRAARRP